MANEVFDLAFLNNKTNTVKKISEQTIRTAKESIEEVRRLMKASHEEVKDLSVVPGKEGYEMSFPVNESFLMKLKFSSKADKAVIQKFVDDYMEFEESLKTAQTSGAPISEEMIKKRSDALSAAMSLAEQRLSQSLFVANQVSADVDQIQLVIKEIMGGDPAMDLDRYLKIRSIISKPSRRVTGLSVRDPEEYQKAIERIRSKRNARK